MSRPDLLPHVLEDWARTEAETHFAPLVTLHAHRDQHQRQAARTRAIHGGDFADDATQWDTVHAVLRFGAAVLVVVLCAALGVWAVVTAGSVTP